jgi:hypothetical protein
MISGRLWKLIEMFTAPPADPDGIVLRIFKQEVYCGRRNKG